MKFVDLFNWFKKDDEIKPVWDIKKEKNYYMIHQRSHAQLISRSSSHFEKRRNTIHAGHHVYTSTPRQTHSLVTQKLSLKPLQDRKVTVFEGTVSSRTSDPLFGGRKSKEPKLDEEEESEAPQTEPEQVLGPREDPLFFFRNYFNYYNMGEDIDPEAGFTTQQFAQLVDFPHDVVLKIFEKFREEEKRRERERRKHQFCNH